MRNLLPLIFSVLLIGCTTTNRGTDGYSFHKKEYENVTPGVEFVLLQTAKEKAEVQKKFFGTDWNRVSAFTEWNPEEGVCKIYIMDPYWQYTPELIGHEVAHCIWGRWHDQEIEPVSP